MHQMCFRSSRASWQTQQHASVCLTIENLPAAASFDSAKCCCRWRWWFLFSSTGNYPSPSKCCLEIKIFENVLFEYAMQLGQLTIVPLSVNEWKNKQKLQLNRDFHFVLSLKWMFKQNNLRVYDSMTCASHSVRRTPIYFFSSIINEFIGHKTSIHLQRRFFGYFLLNKWQISRPFIISFGTF